MGAGASRWLLYAGGPFYAYPYKTLLNAANGAAYERAYAHFRRDHATGPNLAYHCLCLVFQLTGNFGLLAELDAKLGARFGTEVPIMSLSTAAAWAVTLAAQSDAPLGVRLCSVLAIALAYRLRERIRAAWRTIMTLQAPIEVLALQLFVINKVRDTSGTTQVSLPFPQFVALLGGRLFLQSLLSQRLRGALAGAKVPINVALAAFMAASCRDPFGGGVPPFFVGLVGWALSLLTEQRWMLFYSMGFLASLGQGVSHHLAQEEGTLPQLAQVADELAHTTFFPNLLFQSAQASLRAAGLPI